MELRIEIHRMTKSFPKDELFGIVSQMRRAAGSVTRNIAEGQGRLTFGEQRQFLSQARGSLFEVEAELIAASMLEYIDESTRQAMQQRARAVGRMLAGLIRYVVTRETAARRGNERHRSGIGHPASGSSPRQ